jgi:hypothetical protein
MNHKQKMIRIKTVSTRFESEYINRIITYQNKW